MGCVSVLLRRATGAIGLGRPVWLGIVLVLDAAIAVTGIFVGRGSGLLGLLAAGPLLACARCGGRATALVAAYAVALCALRCSGSREAVAWVFFRAAGWFPGCFARERDSW